MNISISSKLLYDNLSKIQGIVGTNNVISIIDNFLFKIENKELKAIATDLENIMTVTIPIEEKGSLSIAVPASRLMENIKYIPEQPILLKIDVDKMIFEIQTSKGNYKLSCFKSDDFPLMDSLKNANTFSIDNEIMFNVINSTLFAMSNDEARKIMTGLYFDFSNENVNFVSTDAQKLVKFTRRDLKVDGNNIVVPKKALNQIKNSIDENIENIEISFDENHCNFKFNNIQLTTRLIIEGKYPDYNAAITENNNNILNVERDELILVLKRLKPFTSKTTNQVIFSINGGKLDVSAIDVDYDSQGKEEITVDYKGEDMKIAFNGDHLLNILNTLDSNEVVIEMSTPNRAALLFPSEFRENENILMLLMPITTQV